MQEYEHLRYWSQTALCHFALERKSETGRSNTKDNTPDTITVGQMEPAGGLSPAGT